MTRVVPAVLLTLAVNVPVATASGPRTDGLSNELRQVPQHLSLSEELLACAPASTAAHGRAGAAHDRPTAEASVIEEILWTESKFDGATPGSPAQFRAERQVTPSAGISSSSGPGERIREVKGRPRGGEQCLPEGVPAQRSKVVPSCCRSPSERPSRSDGWGGRWVVDGASRRRSTHRSPRRFYRPQPGYRAGLGRAHRSQTARPLPTPIRSRGRIPYRRERARSLDDQGDH